MSSIPHVVILGGGFGGLAAANELRNALSPKEAKITLIDKKDWFMVGFAKLWIINGTRTFENSIAFLDELSKKGIDFKQGEVTEIDFENKNVKTVSESFSFDFLIVSMGAVLAPQKIPGLVEYGFNLYDHDQLSKIHDNLLEISSGKIAICIMGMPYKCPPAPFEASLLIDAMLRKNGTRDSVQIHFYSPSYITLPAAGYEVSQQVLDLINAEKIIFHGSCKIKSVEDKKLIFEDSEDDFDLLLAVPPHIAPKIIYDSGLAKEPGFVPIGRDCCTPFENVFAVGDVTSMSVAETMAVPKAGIFAEGEGITVAKNIISKLKSEEKCFLYDGKGGCFIESGRNTASLLQVDMFAHQKPLTSISVSTSENLSKKIEFEKERLSKWL